MDHFQDHIFSTAVHNVAVTSIRRNSQLTSRIIHNYIDYLHSSDRHQQLAYSNRLLRPYHQELHAERMRKFRERLHYSDSLWSPARNVHVLLYCPDVHIEGSQHILTAEMSALDKDSTLYYKSCEIKI
jgi:hypothetical protein